MTKKVSVLYEDSVLAIFNKPAGMLTTPGPGRTSRSLTDILNDPERRKDGRARLYPCHRLDGETSGVVVFAKGKAVQRAVMELFRSQRVAKTYLAIVQGRLGRDQGTITKNVEGKAARTDWKVRERHRVYTLVEVYPKTGRTNQIRLHFKHLGHPLVGESRFAFRKDFPLKARRVLLHAAAIQFPHPVTGALVEVSVPPPKDFSGFVERNP